MRKTSLRPLTSVGTNGQFSAVKILNFYNVSGTHPFVYRSINVHPVPHAFNAEIRHLTSPCQYISENHVVASL